jgi:hypothetical protein
VILQALNRQRGNSTSHQSEDNVMTLLDGASQSSNSLAAPGNTIKLSYLQAHRLKQMVATGMVGSGTKRRQLTPEEHEAAKQKLETYKANLSYGRVHEVVETITDTVHERADGVERRIQDLEMTMMGQSPAKRASTVARVYTQNEQAMSALREENRVCKKFMKTCPALPFGEALERIENARPVKLRTPAIESPDEGKGEEAANSRVVGEEEEEEHQYRTASRAVSSTSFQCPKCEKCVKTKRGLTQHMSSCAKRASGGGEVSASKRAKVERGDDDASD